MKVQFIIVSVAALLPASVAWSQQVEKEKASIWMKKKLEYSQKILAGLTRADFQDISDYAKGMEFLGYLEKAERSDLPGYRQQLTAFEFANQELIKQTQARNLPGATLAYNQLVNSCVQCHRILRDHK